MTTYTCDRCGKVVPYKEDLRRITDQVEHEYGELCDSCVKALVHFMKPLPVAIHPAMNVTPK